MNKKRFFLPLLFMWCAFANAQGPLSSDTMFLGFHIAVPPMDTVDESDTFYMFNPHPDSGLHFRVCVYASWNVDDFDTLIQGTPFIYNDPAHFRLLYNATRYTADSSVQVYGIAVTGMPSILRWYQDLALGTSNINVDVYDWNEPFDLSKEVSAYRVELLDGSGYDSGVSDTMRVLDRVWLDSNSTIKKCWFKYSIDNPDTDTLLKNIGAVDQGLYYPGRTEVVVPCYEFYFENPFDSNHVMNGDFYVGRRKHLYNPYMIEGEFLGFPRPFDGRSFFMREYYPYYHDTANSPVPWLVIDSTTGKVTGQLSIGEKYIRPWGLIFPITGLRCKQLHNVHIEEKGDYYVRIDWQAGDDEEPEYQIQLVDRTKEGGGNVIVSDTLTDSTYMFPGLDEYGKYDFRIRKSCHYASTHYDTIVWSDWHTLSFVMKEMPPVDTTQTDTTGTDTTQIDTTGIRLALGDADFSLRPNPARGSAELRLQYPVAETAELTLYDMRGREVRRMTLRRGDKRVRLDLEGLPAGAYLLKLLTPHGLATRRLLVQ